MNNKHDRLQWTDDSREYRIYLKTIVMHDGWDERKGLCACQNCRGYWTLKKYHRRMKRKILRNWKQYRKTQYKPC